MGYDQQTYRRQKIGDSLRMFREGLGLTQRAACRLLDRSQASLSAYENGHRAIRPRDLKHILDVYGVTDDLVRSRLLSLAAQGRQDGWWHDFEERLEPGVVDFASLEADASSVRSFAPQVVHGLVQSDGYARAVIGGSGTALRRTREEIETDIRFRLNRQKIHDLACPPQIVIVLGEAALRQCMGGRLVMRDQLLKLLEMQERPHIELQVLPFVVQRHPGLDGAFTIMGVGSEGSLEVVTVHSMARTWYVDEPSDVDHYGRTFDLLREVALPETDSRAMIEEIVSEL
ncbi:helix-turn-helix domain-containing protein [Actinomadura verrucosospora]|uniref:XRE family transcriptional regulator n=1 Tax=Actinomadura verrucosospora TaxID=46165 RepID=A0A7D3VPZ7_ACTVE|nr:helix-turn-helix transcriptional regulator [Actinomadura verrucosospora]QKG19570.1 XRE family transcriptional regulator [Actinomadura verrucosospora]